MSAIMGCHADLCFEMTLNSKRTVELSKFQPRSFISWRSIIESKYGNSIETDKRNDRVEICCTFLPDTSS